MHQQFQLILRNTETQASFVWKLLKVGFAHRNARRNALTRPFWLLALAGGYGLSSWAAGGLSSRFVAGNNNVRSTYIAPIRTQSSYYNHMTTTNM